jgi:4-alpha-glucanotransferase
MNVEPPLPRLAALAGVETRYRDVWGHEREVPDAVIAALLAAMGMPDPATAGELAREMAAARWRRLCAPAVVLPAEEAGRRVPVHLPRAAGAPHLAWRLLDEAGAPREGRLAAAEASLADAADAGAEWGVETRLLPLPDDLAAGYYALHLECGGEAADATLIVAPAQCYLPEGLGAGRRAWGLTTQLYALRSARNWGIGDCSDLGVFTAGAARRGARTLGVNPLHALFAAEPRHVSPYSPSSRLFLYDLYIDPEAAPDFADCAAAQTFLAVPETQSRLAAARQAELVDHAAVAALKREAFALLYRSFRERHLGPGGGARSERGAAFRAFQAAGGAALRDFATFEALHELNLAAGNGFSWREWEVGLQNPRSPEVAAFVAANSERIEHAEYLQWEADRQLGEAARRGAEAGLSLGLYRDLAVGVDPHGAAAWADQELLVPGASLGAPPDLLNMKGQDWGLAPIDPLVLRRRGYAPFIASLRANMRHAGVLRIDHVMALQHVYWVPRGMAPSEGGYIAYPFEDLVRILALESHRQRCAVIGEDLGTVPIGFRERMRDANILSCRVLMFEREADGSFIPPDRYPKLATASAGTHDLATCRGYWMGRDLEWRRALDLYGNAEQRAADGDNRARDRRLLLDALIREGVLPPVIAARLLGEGGPEYAPALVAAVYRYLGKTNARLLLVQIEDAVAELEQVNLPGTIDEHPNWRRKLSLTVEEILGDPAFVRLCAAVDEARAQR